MVASNVIGLIMRLNVIVYGLIGFVAVISVFIWQRDQISDLEEQLVIARHASDENEQTLSLLKKSSWKTIDKIVSDLNSCNQLIIEQNEREIIIGEERKNHAKEIENLREKIANSPDLCLNSDIPSELRPVRR